MDVTRKQALEEIAELVQFADVLRSQMGPGNAEKMKERLAAITRFVETTGRRRLPELPYLPPKEVT